MVEESLLRVFGHLNNLKRDFCMNNKKWSSSNLSLIT
jgi:hypothetical protein